MLAPRVTGLRLASSDSPMLSPRGNYDVTMDRSFKQAVQAMSWASATRKIAASLSQCRCSTGHHQLHHRGELQRRRDKTFRAFQEWHEWGWRGFCEAFLKQNKALLLKHLGHTARNCTSSINHGPVFDSSTTESCGQDIRTSQKGVACNEKQWLNQATQ